MREPPDHLSPSGLDLWLKCPASWWWRYMTDVPRDPPTFATVLGTVVHRAIEHALAPDSAWGSDRGGLRLYFDEALDHHAGDVALVAPTDDLRSEMTRLGYRCLDAWLVECGADVTVYAVELELDVTLGGVPFVGKIDCVIEDPRGLIPVDWKSGPKPDLSKPWSDEAIERKMLQPLLYAAALREMGHDVFSTGLIFIPPEGPTGWVGRVVDDADLDAAVSVLNTAWASIEEAVELGEAPTTPNPLCGWCSHVVRCPDGQVKVRERFDQARSTGPAAQLLGLVP